MSKILDVPLDGPSTPQMPNQLGEVCLPGLRAIPVAPGAVEISFAMPDHLLDLNLSTAPARLAVNSDQLREIPAMAGSVAWFHAESDCKVSAENTEWGLLLEIDPNRVESILEEFLVTDLSGDFIGYQSAHQAASLGRQLITHLRFSEPNRLFVEGMSLAILACSLSDFSASFINGAPSSIGTDPRIARAIDYIEAHLADDLSIAAIANVAGMSPSWFQSAFRNVTGKPVFAHVRERRLERARILLADRRLSLSQIAFACGFSSHSHMSRLFRARFGASPREMR